MKKKIVCRVVVEVLGKPKEHVEKAMQGYIEQMKKEEQYTILSEEFAEIKKQDSDLWATFAELELGVKELLDLTTFCFNYMPSTIEILDPGELRMTAPEVTAFMNDLQARLHNVDMVAKQVKMENQSLKANMSCLMSNCVVLLLARRGMTSEELSKYSGVDKDKVEDFLDVLIDKGTVQMKEGVYSLVKDSSDGRKT